MSSKRYFRATITRDATEIATVPLAAYDKECAVDEAVSGDIETSFGHLFKLSDGATGHPYLASGNNDVVEISEAEYQELVAAHSLPPSPRLPFALRRDITGVCTYRRIEILTSREEVFISALHEGLPGLRYMSDAELIREYQRLGLEASHPDIAQRINALQEDACA